MRVANFIFLIAVVTSGMWGSYWCGRTLELKHAHQREDLEVRLSMAAGMIGGIHEARDFPELLKGLSEEELDKMILEANGLTNCSVQWPPEPITPKDLHKMATDPGV